MQPSSEIKETLPKDQHLSSSRSRRRRTAGGQEFGKPNNCTLIERRMTKERQTDDDTVDDTDDLHC